jgi:hypothetical protein
MKLFVIIGLLGLALAGCRSFSPHPWTRDQPSWTAVEKRGEVEYVRANNLTRVKPEFYAKAVAMLATVSAVRLPPEQLQTLATDPSSRGPGLTPFLLRGVTWTNPPLYTIVYWKRDGTSICIEQYSWDGEIYVPGHFASVAKPVIAFLDREPTAVFPRAILGGDRIMTEMAAPYAWGEEPESRHIAH